MIVTMHRFKPAIFALSSFWLYVMLLFLLFPFAGGGLGALVVIPATAFSWFFSTRTALMLNILLVFPVNTLLFNLAAGQCRWDILIVHKGIPGSIALILTGLFISYIRNLRNAHKKMAAKLEEKNRQIMMITHSIVHDLKNPLAGFENLFTLLDGCIDREPELKELIGSAIVSLRYINELLDELMCVARYETGMKKINISDINLPKLLCEVETIFRGKLDEKGILFETNLKENILAGDPDELKKILMNLVGNAIKYCGDSQNPRVLVSSELSENKILIRVADNGIGIPESEKVTIFTKFARASNVGSIHGTGLGLAICKAIIEAHRGTIWCESTEEQGCSFCFSLPVIKSRNSRSD